MILFLDYDGVLHPDPCLDARRLFENAWRLASVLEPYPEISIVLSTSWRNNRARHELTDPLPRRLASRILGVTPRFGDCPRVPALAPYHRQAECEHWLRTHNMADGPWHAIDDRPEWFSPYCEHLIECDPRVGFDERVGRRLASALELSRQRATRTVDFALA